jgi:hypothetical protein
MNKKSLICPNFDAFFTDAEFWETIDPSKVYKLSEFPAPRTFERYKYRCSGAEYTGEFSGGFREGFGTMNWQKGVYEGEWRLG